MPPISKRVMIRVVVTLDLHEGLTLTDLVDEIQAQTEQTARDYGEGITVTVD